jgi:CheY-specific phosphatase CheX
MAISSNDIEVVLKAIWTNVLGKELAATEAQAGEQAHSAAASDPAHVSSCVQIIGDWQGAVMVDCLGATARNIAAAMFAMEADAVGSDEIRDAVGEIANMAGGNLKPLLGGNCQMTLPTVAEGADFRQLVPGAKILYRVAFRSDDGDLAVSILKRTD